MSRIENVKITRTHIGPEDHGIFTVIISFEGDSIGGGIGSYMWPRYPAAHANMIKEILTVLDLRKWEDLPGTYCRVECNPGLVTKRIGHLIKNQWFDMDEFANRMKQEMAALGIEVTK